MTVLRLDFLHTPHVLEEKRPGVLLFFKRGFRQLALEITFQRRNFIEWREILIKMGIPEPVEGVVASALKFFYQFRQEMN